MTAKTIDAALALESARGDAERARIRADGWRAGYAAALEAAASLADEQSKVSHMISGGCSDAAAARSAERCVAFAPSSMARRIRSLPIPEEPR